MRKNVAVFLACFAVLCAVGTAVAHHSHAAEDDENKTVTLTGTVTKIDWTNQHRRGVSEVPRIEAVDAAP